VLQDPAVHDEAPLVLDEIRFTAAWTGEVLLFKRDYRLRDEDQPFGLWLIAAAICAGSADRSEHRYCRALPECFGSLAGS